MKISIQHLDETLHLLEEMDEERAQEAIDAVSEALFENVKFYARPHFRKGQLEKNIYKKVGHLEAEVGVDDANMMVSWKGKRINYVAFVLFGTRPHIIEPKRKKALRFSPKNLDEFVFAKRVRHPGYRGDDFLHTALQKTMENLEKIIKDA